MRAGVAILLVGLSVSSGGGMAQSALTLEEFSLPEQSAGWQEKKCNLYAQIFRDALTAQGHDGLSNAFLSSNQRFIDAQCGGERNLCPISDAELEFADLLTMMTMNEGMASTFVPFGCPN